MTYLRAQHVAIGVAAIDALRDEVMLAPKPGLVSPLDNGAHTDMTLDTFRRSLDALAPWFRRFARAGADGADFAVLRRLGLAAEAAMLAATGGINTHRGAIFSLGLLTAAAGRAACTSGPPGAQELCESVRALWGPALAGAARDNGSHGARVLASHPGTMGARDHALAGFPLVHAVALPALVAARSAGATDDAACVEALFALMAAMDDTNLIHRGGIEGLRFVQEQARAFLTDGGVLAAGWQARALALHHQCVARNLSPGGAADLLACTLFLHRVTAA